MKKSLVVALSLCAFAACAELSEEPNACHWTGAVSGAWTEPGNWLENAVPGTGETAVFDRASGNTTIDFTDMEPVGKILVTGAETPSYTFGTASSQNLLLDQKGWIDVDETVTADQTFKATVCYFCEAQMQSSVYFRNNSSAILKLSSYKGPVTGATGWMGAWNSYYYGSGRIQKIGTPDATSGGGANLRMCMDEGGVLEYTVSGEFYQIITDGTGTRQHIAIDAGCTLSSSNPSSVFAHAGNSDEVWLSGEGTFYLSDNSKKAADSCYLGSATASGIVTFDCKFKRRADNTTTFGFWNPTTYYFNRTNDISGGKLQYHGGGGDKKVYVGTFGSSDAPGALGSGTAAIQWDTSSSLIYTGAGDTLRNPLILNSTAKLYNNGTGTERIESEISGTGALNLYGGAFALACSVPNALSAEAGMSYAFVKKAGEESASYTVGKLVFNGQTELTLEDGVTVEAVAWERKSDAKLNVVTTGGKLVLTGLASGLAPTWLRLNGRLARISDSHELIGAEGDDLTIAARGDVVPNEPTKTVAITSPGEGEKDTLAADETSVFVLRNRETSVEPVIGLGSGQTLAVSSIEGVDGATPIVFTGAGEISGQFGLLAATVVRSNETTGASVKVSTVGDTLAELTLGGDLSPEKPLVFTQSAGQMKMSVDEVAASTFTVNSGVLDLEVGTPLSGPVRVAAANADNLAAVYQRSGSVQVSSSGSYVMGFKGYAYYEVGGGDLTLNGAANFGNEGQTVLVQCGGQINQSSGSFVFGSVDGSAAFDLKDGTFLQSSLDLDANLGGNGSRNGYAVMTVEGPSALFKINAAGSTQCRNFVLGRNNSSSSPTVILNVNDGGRVHCGMMGSALSRGPDARTYVNANGGVFVSAYLWNAPYFGGNQYYGKVDRITIFEKGMTMQCGAPNELTVPLSAPTGKGVASTAWADTETEFVGAPLVKIEGDGAGATAFADFDSLTRRVTGIRVTSPGWEYTEATAVVYYGTVGGMDKVIARIPCTLKDNVCGDFIKAGSNNLTVSVTNTYTGATVVRSASLVLGADDVINPKSALVLDGGTLNMNNKHQAFSSIACNGGKVTNGKPDVTGLAVDFDAAKAGSPLKVDMDLCTLPATVPVTMRNPTAAELEGMRKVVLAEFSNGVPASLDLSAITAPEDWEIVIRGNRLLLHKLLGLSVIIR